MGWQAWLTGSALLMMLAALMTGRLGADLIVLGTVTVLLVFGVITPAEAVSGFSSPAVVVIALLYVVTAGLHETGAMTMISGRLLGRPRTILQAQARLVLPVTILSAFTNNTTLVAAFMPVVSGLTRRMGISASHLFMPLSFAAILGGVCTLIGTSTNLTVAALIEQHNRAHPENPAPVLEMWTLAPAGVCVALAGVAYMLLTARWLLPARAETFGANADAARQYMTAMRVEAGSPVVGQTVEEAELRQLPGLFLSRIDREHESISAVGPEERLQAGDTLVFVGVLDSVVDLQKIRGLTPIADESGPAGHRPSMKLIEAVVSPSSPLTGQTVREAGIRTRYGAVVIAVHREGHRLSGKIGDITIRPGDTLLLEAGPGFARRYKDSKEFHLVSELEGAAAPRHGRAWLALVIMAALIVLLTVEVVPPLTAAMVAAGLMVLGRCCTGTQARRSLDWPVLIVIGGAVALGRAVDNTGLAAAIARGVLDVAGTGGPVAVLCAMYALTVVFTGVMNNNAAAALVFPIGLQAALQAGVNPLSVIVCVTIAASAEFATPFGYQTNLMVMGPGGYKWLDYLRFGGPLTLLAGAACIAATVMFYGPISAG